MTTVATIREDLDEIKLELRAVRDSITRIAVQDNRLDTIEQQLEVSWRKFDELKHCVDKLARHEAACPRDQVNELRRQLIQIVNYQASCPRDRVTRLEKFMAGLYGAALFAFAAGVFKWLHL